MHFGARGLLHLRRPGNPILLDQFKGVEMNWDDVLRAQVV